MIGHDLVQFPGAFISLTSIHAVVSEPDDPSVVYIDYGQGNRIGFAGDLHDVIDVINNHIAAANG
ncbi:hypothetical protein J2X12_002840 [Pseudarthrobacter oxydans]|uniref:Uncharacterized protein n=1 Tax=Pseudarthrobacter oxydans TaxID=1671 RepID=A0AAW8NBX8_PSEOX|nr:hypothetical protein [Pseudarthrobacter oxydans]MDR6794829.1 hypothetical protein [Pseudarthrobacter oxydans]MDR7164802.1 hypothetical protein [Pseudarthrobacter oxydans]